VPLQHGAVGLGGVLHAAVAVVELPRWRVMVLEGHDQRVDAEPRLQVVRHGPAYDLACGHVLAWFAGSADTKAYFVPFIRCISQDFI
jgi:hypothetical protein